MSSITITLPQQEKSRLARLASRYGLSIAELSRQILETLSETVPSESIREYEHPVSLKQSIRRGYRDQKSGRIRTTL